MTQLFCNQIVTGFARAGRVKSYSDILSLWLERTRPRVKASTFAAYSGVVQRNIQPALGTFSPKQLTSEVVGKFLSEATEKYSPATARLICHVLRSTLEYARTIGARLPGELELSVPRGGQREAQVLSAEDRRRLEALLRKETDGAALGLLICMFTGIRLGELCALKWGDFSPDCTAFQVRRTLQRLSTPGGAAKTALCFGAPKSESSNRLVPLPSCLLDDVKRLRCGDDCFVLTGEAQRTLEPRRMEARFKTALRRAGVPQVNFHALRHTFATSCIDNGCDPATLARILGHADVSVTLNTYVHPSFSSMRAAVDRAAGAVVV